MNLSVLQKCQTESFFFFSGGQSDQGYDSLSKEEERVCSRESDSATLLEDKGPRQSCELLIEFISPIFDLYSPFMQE